VDPFQLTGSGPDASVSLDDVEATAAAPASAAKPAGDTKDVGKESKQGFEGAEMRRAIARAMTRSKREIPHYYLGTTIDLHNAQHWLEEHNRERTPEERILMPALLLKATALALARYPDLNGHYVEEAFQLADNIHLGVAVHLRGGGLIAPALLDADKLSLQELMRRLQDLVGRARSGGLRSSEVTSPTVTVTSLGERGVETVYGIIYPPQVAMIGFGRVLKKPWALDDAIAIRPVVNATLAADHRVCDGHLGALFLNEIDRRLQQPGEELA
jgi:pyruvate dehydrogenase E2 component (dihydrolipoamide acetyltransferase)